MKNFLEEFKEFALRGNVMDMSIGVIVGAAFGNIVKSLTDNFINPLIALVTGGVGEDGITIGGQFKIGGVVFNYGAFLSEVINFLIMAFVLFCLLKAINKAMSFAKKEEPEAPKEDPADIKLMKEMLAIMKEQDPEAAKKAEEKLAAESAA